VHFIGELEFGDCFAGVAQSEGLLIDFSAHAGPDWLPIAKPEGYVGQTQTSYAGMDGTHVFNHPIDFHYFATSLAGWPCLHIEVLKLDSAGRVETVSYGAASLPNAPGHCELECRTWTPANPSGLDALCAGGPTGALGAPRTAVLAGHAPEERTRMVTKASGSVRVALDTIFRNSKVHGIRLSK